MQILGGVMVDKKEIKKIQRELDIMNKKCRKTFTKWVEDVGDISHEKLRFLEMWKRINLLMESTCFINHEAFKQMHFDSNNKPETVKRMTEIRVIWENLWREYEEFTKTGHSVPDLGPLLCLDNITGPDFIYLNNLMESQENVTEYSKKENEKMDKIYSDARKVCGKFIETHVYPEGETFSMRKLFNVLFMQFREAYFLKMRAWEFAGNNGIYNLLDDRKFWDKWFVQLHEKAVDPNGST